MTKAFTPNLNQIEDHCVIIIIIINDKTINKERETFKTNFGNSIKFSRLFSFNLFLF